MNTEGAAVTGESSGGWGIRFPLILGAAAGILAAGPIITHAIQYIDCANQFCLKTQETAANIGPASMCLMPCLGVSLVAAAAGILIHLLGNTKG